MSVNNEDKFGYVRAGKFVDLIARLDAIEKRMSACEAHLSVVAEKPCLACGEPKSKHPIGLCQEFEAEKPIYRCRHGLAIHQGCSDFEGQPTFPCCDTAKKHGTHCPIHGQPTGESLALEEQISDEIERTHYSDYSKKTGYPAKFRHYARAALDVIRRSDQGMVKIDRKLAEEWVGACEKRHEEIGYTGPNCQKMLDALRNSLNSQQSGEKGGA